MNRIKYPDITIILFDEWENSFLIMGKVIQEMKNAKFSQDQFDEYLEDATSGDYDNMLAITKSYVNVIYNIE